MRPDFLRGSAILVAMLTSPIHQGGAIGKVSLHPLHTTLTEMAWEGTSRRVTIRLRLFTEDFASAVGRHAHGSIPGGPEAVISDSLAVAYLRATLTLTDRAGNPVRLAWGSSRRQGGVSFITLTGTSATGASGSQVWSVVNCEIFEDQVNIVKALYRDHSESMLFTRGDPPKTLP